jgi:hypothetical protein
LNTKYRILVSRELSDYELRKLKGYLSMNVGRDAILAMIGNVLDCRCSLTMLTNDGFDGTLRCDSKGEGLREYTLVV